MAWKRDARAVLRLDVEVWTLPADLGRSCTSVRESIEVSQVGRLTMVLMAMSTGTAAHRYMSPGNQSSSAAFRSIQMDIAAITIVVSMSRLFGVQYILLLALKGASRI